MYVTAPFQPMFASFGASMPRGTSLQPASSLPAKTPLQPVGCPTCPAPLDCPTCDCGSIATPEACEAIGFKSGAVASGVKWWWLLVAGGAGIGIGYAAAKMAQPKPKLLHGW